MNKKELNFTKMINLYYDGKEEMLELCKHNTCSFIFPKDVVLETLEYGLKVTIPILEPVIIDNSIGDEDVNRELSYICLRSGQEIGRASCRERV